MLDWILYGGRLLWRYREYHLIDVFILTDWVLLQFHLRHLQLSRSEVLSATEHLVIRIMAVTYIFATAHL